MSWFCDHRDVCIVGGVGVVIVFVRENLKVVKDERWQQLVIGNSLLL